MTALSYIEIKKLKTLGIDIEYFDQYDLHNPRAGAESSSKRWSFCRNYDVTRWLSVFTQRKIKAQNGNDW